MNSPPHRDHCIHWSLVVLILVLFAHDAVADDWFDTFYQYRVPLETRSQQAGWQEIPVSESQIVAAINSVERFQFDPQFMAWNAATLVEVDEAGELVDPHLEAGFYLIQPGDELADGALASGSDQPVIRVSRNQPHLLIYTSSGVGKCPALEYETIFPPGSRLRRNDYRISWFPPLLPLDKTTHEVFFVPDREEMQLSVGGRWIGKLHDLSVRQVRVALLAKVNRPGVKRWMLYYQPMCSHHLQIPTRRRNEAPDTVVAIEQIGAAEKRFGDTTYRLSESDSLIVSFADSTVKVTRHMKPPTRRREKVIVRSAANERQSFQLLLTPRRADTTLTGVEVTDLSCGEYTIPSSLITSTLR